MTRASEPSTPVAGGEVRAAQSDDEAASGTRRHSDPRRTTNDQRPLFQLARLRATLEELIRSTPFVDCGVMSSGASPRRPCSMNGSALHARRRFFAEGGAAAGRLDVVPKDVFTDPKVKIAAAACLTEGQLWDISDPLFPCTVDETCRTHLDNALVEVWHSSALTWDSNIVLFGDEHGGGVVPGCGSTNDTSGNIRFYKNNGAGAPRRSSGAMRCRARSRRRSARRPR